MVVITSSISLWPRTRRRRSQILSFLETHKLSFSSSFASPDFHKSIKRQVISTTTTTTTTTTTATRIRVNTRQGASPNTQGLVLVVRAYTENPNSISSLAGKIIGSLPVVGLLARIVSDEGGVGGDTIDFAEFRRRVGNKCGISDSRAFIQFKDRRGRAGDPLYVLLCCWLAAIGAGLLKSEEILEGVARLRISNDIEFEEENFLAIMNDAKERRAKLNVAAPEIPMALRAEKALEAIYVCCFGSDPIEEEDERLLRIMLNAVFPSVGKSEIDRIVSAKVMQIAEGEIQISPEPKRLSKEAVMQQMKDLQFLKRNSET